MFYGFRHLIRHMLARALGAGNMARSSEHASTARLDGCWAWPRRICLAQPSKRKGVCLWRSTSLL